MIPYAFYDPQEVELMIRMPLVSGVGSYLVFPPLRTIGAEEPYVHLVHLCGNADGCRGSQ
jgi:hypothetical protein